MTSARPLILAASLILAVPAAAQSFPAQPLQTMPVANPDADALANAMRRLGSNPRDLSALIEAGELSLKLGDVNAAAALFKRADMIDPMNGRVKAGMARILVSQERPGEALRYFDQATGYGLDPRSFAGDRGLAYDLIGEQERAQRDYRVALKAGESDEVQRRYALSLGISGKREAALTEIDALLRRKDRGAWRARAFILAMSGDVPGAEKIAQTMMPPGMGAALAPFFARLATLPSPDRAFAVHFGELRPTPARLADAKLTPPLPVLAPEPSAPVQVAAVAVPNAAPVKRDRRAERAEARRVQLAQRAAEKARRQEERRVQLAQREAARRGVRVANGVAYGPSRAVVQPLPSQATRAPVQTAALAPTRLPSAVTAPVSAAPAVPNTTSAPSPATVLAFSAPTATPPTPAGGTTPPVTVAPTQATTLAGPPNAPTPLDRSAATVLAAGPSSPQPGFTTSISPAVPPAAVAAAPTVSEVAPSSTSLASATPAPAATPPAAVTPAPPIVAKLDQDTILARIMAGISIPASELGVGVAPAATPAPGTTVATPASIASAEQARRNAEAERRAQIAKAAARPAEAPATKAGTRPARTLAKTEVEETKPGPRGGNALAKADVEEPVSTKPSTRAGKALAKADTDEPATKAGSKSAKTDQPLDAKAAARKAAADRKAAEAKKLADAKKAEEKKKAAEETRAAKAEPPRIWVQVAGGANEGDLPKAWAAVKGKTPALAGKTAYSTPLRATNRVVTGPFKTDAEARAFVNTLAKQGVSAFPFTSEKGQKMTKLGGK